MRLLNFDYIEIELYSLSRIKIDFCEIKRIEVFEEEYIQFNLFSGDISIKIEYIETIKIE